MIHDELLNFSEPDQGPDMLVARTSALPSMLLRARSKIFHLKSEAAGLRNLLPR